MPSRSRIRAGRIALWFAFAGVHLVLAFLALHGPNLPLGDVSITYLRWMSDGLLRGDWVGVDLPWVYPYPAMAPMLVAAVAGLADYSQTWLVLVTLLDAAALAALTGIRRPRHLAAGWYWIAFSALLGPIAVARIDAISVAIVIPALVVAATRPRLAALLITLGAWIKIWPAAIGIALVVGHRQRLRILGTAVSTSLALLLVGLIVGGATSLSFLTYQSGRGIQVESVVGTAWMWAAALGGDAAVHYDLVMLTFQIEGPGLDAVAAVLTPLLMVAAGGVAALGVRAVRRGARTEELLPSLMLALVLLFILINKVGSPQIFSWLAVPVIAAMLVPSRGHGSLRGPVLVPAISTLAIAGLTQLIYPYLYNRLLALDPALLGVLTLRNLACIALFAWVLRRLVLLGGSGTGRLDLDHPVPDHSAPDVSIPDQLPAPAGERSTP